MEQCSEEEFDTCLIKLHNIREAINHISAWLNKNKTDPRYERNRDIRNQLELYADNLWEYGEIERPEDEIIIVRERQLECPSLDNIIDQ
jgi:hypothetical protein